MANGRTTTVVFSTTLTESQSVGPRVTLPPLMEIFELGKTQPGIASRIN
jgi:hypothetical protein